MNHKFKKIILLSGDIIILYISLFITLALRYHDKVTYNTWQAHFLPFSIAFVAWIIIFYISDLYNLHLAVNNSRFFHLTIRAVIIAELLSVVFFYANPNITIAPKTNLIIYFFIFIILFHLWRRFFNWTLNTYLPKNKLIIIGYNNEVKELAKVLEQKPHLGYKIALIIAPEANASISSIPIANKTNDLKSIIINQKISTLIMASDPRQSAQLRAEMLSLLPLKINFINLSSFYENITGKIPIKAINETWFLENLNEGNKAMFDLFKRSYDIILAILILFMSLPFWIIIGILLKIENNESIFFIQKRAGKNNKTFNIIKFRTQKTISNDPEPSQKNDSRTTKFGGFARRTRIDEIPQVLNIIMGQMSFIGPRPERPKIIKKLEEKIPFYQERMLVKPGLTGWDQVSGEYHSPSYEDTMKKLQYDLFYIKNRSIYLDISIALKTIATILKKNGV